MSPRCVLSSYARLILPRCNLGDSASGVAATSSGIGVVVLYIIHPRLVGVDGALLTVEILVRRPNLPRRRAISHSTSCSIQKTTNFAA